MNTKDQFVITINRELGSGGRTVGEKLAAKLGVPYYDKALINALMEKYKVEADTIEKIKGQKQIWWREFIRAVIVGQNAGSGAEDYLEMGGEDPNLISTEQVFKAEAEILRGLAEAESCVIAGRSGFFVLKDHPNHFSILIQASMEHRIERVMERQGLSREDAIKAIDKVDKQRENYVSNFGHTSRYDARNYDLVVKMDGKSEDEVADLIYNFVK